MHKTTLVIGDSHADPRFPNDRFIALGNFIIEHRPDYIVDIGDFGNLDSISFHNRDKPLLKEGMRLIDDINAMKDAHDKLMAPMKREWERASNLKKKKYKPIMKKLEGNHEYRAWRYISGLPELQGVVPTTDFVGAAEDGWEIYNYKEYTYHEGIAFCHVPMSPLSNTPLSGKYMSFRILEGQQQTTVYGHNHRLEVNSLKRNGEDGGRLIFSIGCGCYFDYDPEYIRGNEGQLNWWRGLLLLHHVAPGEVDIQTYSITRIKNEYL